MPPGIPRHAAPLALLLPILLVAPAAGASGVIYLPQVVDGKATIDVEILRDYAVSVDAGQDTNADGAIDTPGVYQIDLTQYLPVGLTYDTVIVKVFDASHSVDLVALDANNTEIARADVIPLATGYSVTLPKETTVIKIENLAAQVWSGTITVIVQSTVDIDIQFGQTQVNIVAGYAEVPATVVVYTAPDGSLILKEGNYYTEFDVKFKEGMIQVPAHSDPANPLNIPATIAIATTAQPGTYNLVLEAWFNYSQVNASAKLAELNLTITLAGDAGATTDTSDDGGLLDVNVGPAAVAVLLLGALLVGAAFVASRR